MAVRTLVVGPLQTNCYLAVCTETKEAIVIDPGGDARRIMRAVNEEGVAVRLIVDTHAHFDHVAANGAIHEATGAPIAIHRLDADALTQPVALFGLSFGGPVSPSAQRLLEEGDEVRFGNVSLRVLHTPGHTPGGISLLYEPEPAVFSGDALFQYGIGRTDFPGGDPETLLRSIRSRLFPLPDATVVYPGHGPTTTIGAERLGNPWLGAE
ncbi:MAG: MBL fold metallo-hydrolase [Anaerolineae bacterium]|nr:MBL fold metallo-hydrolase [Anaerolineae bacterium]